MLLIALSPATYRYWYILDDSEAAPITCPLDSRYTIFTKQELYSDILL